MVYDTVLIDVFNLMHRCKGNTVAALVNAAIDRTEEALDHLKKSGKLYLLYDPLPIGDLGISKVFKYGTGRKAEDNLYKANRKVNDTIIDGVQEYRKYWIYRGENIVSVYGDDIEADDYVECIVGSSGRTAMLTTDSDWSRYLSENVEMIPGLWTEPFTMNHFIETYGFIPTVASVTLNKAFFGDSADNIKGVIRNKKVPKAYKNLINDSISWVGEEGISLQETMDYFDRDFSLATLDYECKNPLDDLSTKISAIDISGVIVDQLQHNVRLISSRCRDLERYTHSNPINDTVNTIMEESLGRIQSKKPFTFGKVAV